MNNDSKGIQVDHHDQLAKVQKTMDIVGLEEVPTNMMPVPFYKLVQPGTTGVTLSDGQDAPPGTFFMADSGECVKELTFALLRAKRKTSTFTEEDGSTSTTNKMAILGINLTNMSPFSMDLSVASFSGFGRLMKQFKESKATVAWQFQITATTEKKEETKMIKGKMQKVKYYVVNFSLGEKALDTETIDLMQKGYEEFASTLDKNEPAKEEVKQTGSSTIVLEGKPLETVNPDDIPF